METAPIGLVPHDVARDALHADLLWRNRTRFAAVHSIVRNHVIGRYENGSRPEQERALRELVYLHRDNPLISGYFEFRSIGRVYPEPAGPGDQQAIRAIIRRHEGKEFDAAATHWFSRQPEAFVVLRDGDRIAGLMATLDLSATDAADCAADPVLASVLAQVDLHDLRKGERATLCRFLMAADTYQAPSGELTALQIQSYLQWLMTPQLGWAIIMFDATSGIGDLLRYVDFHPLGTVTASGGRRFELFGHDWRRVNSIAWLDMMASRELDTEGRVENLRPAESELVVLSQGHFAEAVRRALRDLRSDSALGASPLLRSAIVAGSPEARRVAALRALIVEASRGIIAAPRDEKFFRAVDLTYLNPAPTQEAAAERLGLPFGTYRYRLETGVKRIVRRLWEEELRASNER